MASGCVHIAGIARVKPPTQAVCQECAKMASQWVHLRTCQSCGATLCCDSSLHQHAGKHARSSGHPVIASAERGERWLSCDLDQAFVEY